MRNRVESLSEIQVDGVSLREVNDCVPKVEEAKPIAES